MAEIAAWYLRKGDVFQYGATYEALEDASGEHSTWILAKDLDAQLTDWLYIPDNHRVTLIKPAEL